MADDRHNGSVQFLTQHFNQQVPTLSEVAQAASQVEVSNMFSVMHGHKGGPSMGEIIRANRAADIQQRMTVRAALMDERAHEMAVAKLMRAEQQGLLDLARETTRMGHEASGRVYTELLKVLPQLDEGSASRLMQSISDDPTDVMGMEGAVSGEKYLVHHMNKVGIKYREKKRGAMSMKVPDQKVKRQPKTIVDLENNRVVMTDNLGNVVTQDIPSADKRMKAAVETVIPQKPKVSLDQLRGIAAGNKKATAAKPKKPDVMPELEIEVENPGQGVVDRLLGLFD